MLRKVEASVLKSSIDIPSLLPPPLPEGLLFIGDLSEGLSILNIYARRVESTLLKSLRFANNCYIGENLKRPMTEYVRNASDCEAVRAEIIALEKQALERWNNGDPDGFIELSADDVVYIDPAFEHKLEGKKALETYYDQVRGKIKIDRYEMQDPVVQVSPGIAVLTYNYEAYRDGCVFRMNCTEVYRLDSSGPWRIIHTHWSFFQPHK